MVKVKCISCKRDFEYNTSDLIMACEYCRKGTTLFVKKRLPNATLPKYEHEGDSGFDLSVCFEKDEMEILKVGEIKLFDTGLSFEIPRGYEIQIRPRSGMAAKKGVTVINSPGTIDEKYVGPIKIALINLGKEDVEIKQGMRVAQGVLCNVPKIKNFVEVEEINKNTSRGEGGFGSTGE
jgi:dUTP pyrophosphatase